VSNRPRYYADVPGYVRPELLRFAVLLERELRVNDEAKGWEGWKKDRPNSLLKRVHEELEELDKVYRDDVDPQDPSSVGVHRDLIAEEASDVGNMLMMFLDVLGILPELQSCSPLEKARNTILNSVKDLLTQGGMMFVDLDSWAQTKEGNPLRALARAYIELTTAEKEDAARREARAAESAERAAQGG